MKVIDDGVIKYDRSNFSHIESISEDEYNDLEYQREKLYQLGLIGVDPKTSVGYGNISKRFSLQKFKKTARSQFIITGTQTGKFKHLDGKCYTRVIDFNIEEAKIHSMGAIEASSEALTHAAIYDSNPNINAIIHIHSEKIWNYLIGLNELKIESSIEYGTIEMASAASLISKKFNHYCFPMVGHYSGVIHFSDSLDKCTEEIIQLYQMVEKKY
jgi:hypothetical protein